MKFIYTIYLSLALLSTYSCSHVSKEDTTLENIKSIPTNRDSEAYKTGYDEAQRMIDNNLSEEGLHNKLLDTRAVIYLIEQRNGKQEAADYEAGFTDAIKEKDPSLAAQLFSE